MFPDKMMATDVRRLDEVYCHAQELGLLLSCSPCKEYFCHSKVRRRVEVEVALVGLHRQTSRDDAHFGL